MKMAYSALSTRAYMLQNLIIERTTSFMIELRNSLICTKKYRSFLGTREEEQIIASPEENLNLIKVSYF